MFIRKNGKRLRWIIVGLTLFIFGGEIATQKVSAATDLVADIASYQPDNLAFFQSLKNKGVKGVTIKITEGTSYVNPKAATQIRNAQAAGLAINVYHFARFNSSNSSMNDPVAEANYFTNQAKKMGIPTSAIFALDIEDWRNYTNSAQITKDINTFSLQVQKQGYLKTATYSMSSWFTSGTIIKPTQLRDPNLWIADYNSYGSAYPTNAWQYTSSFNSGYNGNYIDMSKIYDGYLSHTTGGYFTIDRQYPSKKVILSNKDYGLFNTPSPIAGAQQLVAGNQLNRPTVEAVAMFRVSNGEYYYNFKYGNRYYWTNTRAFTDTAISEKKAISRELRVSSSAYGFYNTPADLTGSKELITPSQTPQNATVTAIAEYTLNNGTSYYNFQYGNRYYWADTRSFTDADIVKTESINKDVTVVSKQYGFYNTPATLPGAQQLIAPNQTLQTTVRAIAKYTLKDGTSYYNFQYGDRYYWADVRAFKDAVTITKKESVDQDIQIISKQYGFYNTPATLPDANQLISSSQVPQTTVHAIAKYTLSDGTSYYNFQYGNRYYWLDTRATRNVVSITKTEAINQQVKVSSQAYGFYNTPASLPNAQLLVTAGQVPLQATVQAIAKYTLSDGTSHYNFKYGNRYYWSDVRTFTDVSTTIVAQTAMSQDAKINSKDYGLYNTPANLPNAKQLLTPSQAPQTTVHIVAQYTLSDGTSYYNFAYGSRYYWLDTRAFE